MPTTSAARTTTKPASLARDSAVLGPMIHPGEMLLEELLRPRGLQQSVVADELGISRNRLNLGGHPKPAINRHLKTGHFLMAVDRDVDLGAEPVLQRRHGERLGATSSAASRRAGPARLVAAPH